MQSITAKFLSLDGLFDWLGLEHFAAHSPTSRAAENVLAWVCKVPLNLHLAAVADGSTIDGFQDVRGQIEIVGA